MIINLIIKTDTFQTINFLSLNKQSTSFDYKTVKDMSNVTIKS